MALNLIFYFCIFLFGISTGSFLNSIIYRLQTSESFLLKRSYCPNCKKTLSWQELIPLLSFLFLKRRCRFCKNPISLQYPLVELATGILFILVLWHLDFGFDLVFGFWHLDFLRLLYLFIITCFLIIIFVSDLKSYSIPDKVIYPAILVSGIWYLVSGISFNLYTKYEILNTIYSAFGASAFFLAIVLVSRARWMGWGDPKLAFFMGLFLGFPKILIALFSAFFIGAIIGIGLIIFQKKTLKSEVPFGPFLVTGTFVALFWGNNLINWYLNLFLG